MFQTQGLSNLVRGNRISKQITRIEDRPHTVPGERYKPSVLRIQRGQESDLAGAVPSSLYELELER